MLELLETLGIADKVDTILGIEYPKRRKEMRKFMGLVNFYRDMQKDCSHLLAPLAALTSKKRRLKWTKKCEKVFEGVKVVIVGSVMLLYCPHFNKEFVIHTDASNMQLEGVITQGNRPLTF